MATADEFELQDVIDAGAWGPEPTESYLESLDLLDNVVRECIWVSKRYAGIASPEGRHYYASVLFVAMITRGVSLLNLAPHTPWAQKRIEHWDYASMTGVVRTMIELRGAFHYLCSDPCPPEEWQCRWNLFNLHDCVSRIRLFTARGDDEQVAGLELQAEELRERLRGNDFFKALDPKRHRKLLHGQTAYLFPLETLAERAGMAVETFRWLYILFSTHVHALPMSFYRIGDGDGGRGRGLPSSVEENYSALCLSLAASLIVGSRDELHALFHGLAPEPGAEGGDDPAGSALVEEDEAMLAVGETDSVELDDELLLVRKRHSDEETLVSYVHRPTGDTVFEGTASTTDGLQFEYIDPYFWNITIDGAKTSRAAVERLVDAEFLMRIDLEERRILFKTRTVAEDKATPESPQGWSQ